MGRTMHSVRMEVKRIAERWASVKKALKKEDQQIAEKLAEMAKKHSNEVFYLFDDPLEAAVFSVLLEMQKQIERDGHVDSGLLGWQQGSALDKGWREGKKRRV